MLINLYGSKGLVFQTLATGFNEAHIQDKIKFDVVEADKVGSKFKEAVKKAYNAKFLDDADMVIRFAEIVQAPPEEDNQSEQAPDEGNDNDGNPPDGQKAEEKPEENTGAEEEKQDKENDDKGEGEKEQAQQQEETPDDKSEDKEEDKKEKVNEAANATSATGADLKKKIVDTVKRCLFQEDESKIELSDLQGFIDGYNVSFIKVSLKDKGKENSIEPVQ